MASDGETAQKTNIVLPLHICESATSCIELWMRWNREYIHESLFLLVWWGKSFWLNLSKVWEYAGVSAQGMLFRLSVAPFLVAQPAENFPVLLCWPETMVVFYCETPRIVSKVSVVTKVTRHVSCNYQLLPCPASLISLFAEETTGFVVHRKLLRPAWSALLHPNPSCGSFALSKTPCARDHNILLHSET